MADEVLGRMAIKLDLKDSNFTKGLTGAKQATRNAMSEMKANLAVVGQTGSKYDILAQKGRGLTKALEAQKREMRLLDKEYKNSLTSNGEQTRASAKYAQQANNARAKVEALNRQIVENAKAMARAKVETTGWTGKLNTVSKYTVQAGQKMSKFGDTFTKRVSAPIGAGFIYSAKQAIDFKSQIAALGPLLTNGGKLTAQYRKQLDQLAGSSKRWSKQYGVSTNDINSGMGELIRKGYTAKQTLGAMPAILDATKASGDSFNDVMHVSTSVLEQFGLKTKSTAGTLKNTTRVTDTLTTIANRTSAGFKDMGDAMVYIGPSAHAAGISLKETAAMVGILSNKGIEGSQAGTALRGALTRLIKPSNQNVEGFKKLGINVEDFKKGTLTMPDLLDKIKNNTKGWTKEQRAAAVAMAFGTEAQSGMNALISAGGGELRKYTKYAENSAGSTKKIAESMNNTQAAKIKRFQQALHVLSIDIGEKLLPAFEPILTKADQWINKFDNMSDHTQSLIVKAGLLAVALGPIASVLGRVLTTAGKFGTGIVKVKGYFAAVRAGKDAMDALGIGSKTASAGMAQVERSAVGSAGKVGALGTSFRLLNPYVLGATVAIGAGITVWELWGKKAAASAERTSRWGTDVGATADTALTKFKGTSTGIDDALNDLDTSFSTSTKSMSKAFDTEFSNIEKSAHDHMKGVEDSIKGLDPEVAAAVEKQAQKNKQTLDKINADAKAHNAEAQAILKNHNGKIADLNDDERQLLKNDQFAMQQDELKALNITGSKKKLVMANLNRDYSKMSQAQRDSQIRDLDYVAKKTTTSMAKQQRALKKALDSGRINQSEYNKGMKALGDKTSSVLDKAAAEYIKLERASGKSTATIKSDMLEQGLSYQNGMKYIKQHSNAVKISAKEVVDTTGKMSKATRKAGEMWNKLVFDPKTGEVKTNAQEEINKAVKSGKQWDQIKLLAKEGKLSTNAKEMVATAAISQGKWDGMTWKEQKALIRSEGGKDLVKLMENSGEWNDLSIKEKTALVNAKGQKEIADLLMKTGIWNDLTVEEKTLVLKNSGTNKLYDLLDKLDLWNKLTIDEKTAVISGDDKGIANMLVRTNQWNSLSLKQQQAYVGTKGGKELSTQLDKIGVWNSLTPKEQVAIMTAKGKPEMVDALVTAGVWNNLTLPQKQAQVKTEGTVDLIDQLNKMGQWNNLTPEAKNAIVHAKGSAEIGDILTQYNLWSGLPPELVKQMIAEDKASGNTKAATDALYNYNRANPNHKIMNADDKVSPKVKVIGGSIGQYNKKNPNKKNFNGNASSITKASNQSTKAQDKHNKKKVNKKFFNANPSSILKASSQSTSAQDRHNRKKVTKKSLPGTASSIVNASNSGIRAIGNFNGKHTTPKHLKGHDNTSGPAKSAIRAANSFNAVKETTKHFKSIFTTIKNIITNHKKNATGTNFHPGGLMEVNDQPGHVFREMVRYPNGESFIPRGRNVFLNAPAGTQVLRADLTAKKFRGLPQYANGIGDNTRLLNQAVDVTNQLKADSGTRIVNNTSNVDLSGLVAGISQMTNLLQIIAAKNPSLNIDGREVGKVLAPNISDEQMNDINYAERRVYRGR